MGTIDANFFEICIQIKLNVRALETHWGTITGQNLSALRVGNLMKNQGETSVLFENVLAVPQ